MKARQTQMEIHLKNLKHNVNYLKSHLSEGVNFMAVVKASCYGSGANPIANYLEKHRLADYFVVAYPSEGVALRQAGIQLPILVMHSQEVHFEDIVTHKLEPALYSSRILNLFLNFLKDKNIKNYPVHLKCNTGFNRLGIHSSEISDICHRISQSQQIKLISAYAHLSASEDLSERVLMESLISRFIDFQSHINNIIPYKVLYHMCNTSGILNYPQAHFDMVRSGIGMYGFGNDPQYQSHLLPIASLKSVISQIHHLKKGDLLGYNRGFTAERDMKTATISIGHADGINRIYGKKKGFVFINEKKAFILGNVCMDMIMVDVSDINCEEGDEVVIFDQNHLAEDLANAAGTISYELITSISERIRRIYIE